MAQVYTVDNPLNETMNMLYLNYHENQKHSELSLEVNKMHLTPGTNSLKHDRHYVASSP
jgi:hypothetical protein